MKRVCILTSAHSPYDDRIYYREAVSLKRAGYDVTIVAPWEKSEVTPDGISIEAVSKAENRVERFLFSGWRVYKAALIQNSDIYHFHDPDLIPWMTLLALQGHRIIYDVHEYVAQSILTKEWVPSYVRRLLASFMDCLEKAASREFSGIITVNPHMERLFRSYNTFVETVANFPLPWFIESFSKSDSSQTGLIMYIGGLNKDRGYELIMRTMACLEEDNTNANLRIIGPIAYDGIDNEYPRLERGQEYRNICWEGSIPFADVPSKLKQAQVCWIPWQNTPNNDLGTPVKLFEYMASGCPLVASDLSFISQILREYRCGLLVDPKDPHAHAGALHYLITHPKEAQEMGARGRKAVEEKYNWPLQEKGLLTLYEKLLN